MHIALIEIGAGHVECLYSQILFLQQKGATIDLFLSEEIYPHATHLASGVRRIIQVPMSDSGWKSWWYSYQFAKKLSKQTYDFLIFNTAQGGRMKRIALFLPAKEKTYFGTLHNLKKITSSKGQQIISRKVKSYFLLHDHLLSQVPSPQRERYQWAVYYPAFFPDFNSIPLHKSEEEIWIGIPGQVECKRRDYSLLFQQIKSIGLSTSIKLLFLGKSAHAHGDREKIAAWMEEADCKTQVKVWDNFIPYDTLHSYLQKCDFILPLIHPSNGYEQYYYQISGAYNLAIAHKTPLLLDYAFMKNSPFGTNALYYKPKNLVPFINQLPPTFTAFQEKKWSVEEQSKRYFSLLPLSSS